MENDHAQVHGGILAQRGGYVWRPSSRATYSMSVLDKQQSFPCSALSRLAEKRRTYHTDTHRRLKITLTTRLDWLIDSTRRALRALLTSFGLVWFGTRTTSQSYSQSRRRKRCYTHLSGTGSLSKHFALLRPPRLKSETDKIKNKKKRLIKHPALH